mgnify:CR=1 FL=1
MPGKGWLHDPSTNTYYDPGSKSVWSKDLKVAVDLDGGVYRKGERLPAEALPPNIKPLVDREVARARKQFGGRV